MVKENVQLAVMLNDLQYIKEKITSIEERVDGSLVTKDQFESRIKPLEKVVYGLVALVLTGVVLALLSLVILKK